MKPQNVSPAGLTAGDPRPAPLRRDVKLACEGVTVVALSISIELNVWDHFKNGHMLGLLAWTIGIAVPLVVALFSHVAAHVHFHGALKFWVGAIVALLMYVSASAGTRVLSPGMNPGPALGTAAGLDLAALTALGLLMFNSTTESALAAWKLREDERRRQAQTAEMVAAFSRQAQAGNTTGNGARNTVPLPAGNTAPVTAPVTDPAPVQPPAAPELPSGDSDTDIEAGEGGGPDAKVFSMPQRPVPTREQMYDLARAMGDDLSVRNFRAKYRGAQEVVAEVVRDVKAERAAKADATRRTAGGGR